MTKYQITNGNNTKTYSSKRKAKDAAEALPGEIDVEPVETDGGTEVQENPPHDHHGNEVDGNAEVVETSPADEPIADNAASGENAIDVANKEEFVTEVQGVPEQFVLNMGTPDNKSIHVTKEGYYYLAAEQGLDHRTEPLNPTWEGDSEMSAWKGIVTDGEKEWSNVGTAHLKGEDMQGARYNLDELAATRAACRALSMATGTGIVSAEEMAGGEE